jgi:hypothetical protein
VEDGGADVAGQAGQFVVGLVLRAGLELLRRKTRQRGLFDDAPGQPQRLARRSGGPRPVLR